MVKNGDSLQLNDTLDPGKTAGKKNLSLEEKNIGEVLVYTDMAPYTST